MDTILQKRVFGIPVWLIALVVGGIGFWWYKNHQASASGTSGNTGNGTVSSSQTVTGTTPSGGTYTDSYSAQGSGYSSGQILYDAGSMPYSSGDIYVNYPSPTNTTGTTIPPDHSRPDVYNAAGQDLGKYLYGSKQISYLQNNVGNFGITSSEVQDVINAYNNVMSKSGQGTADQMHFSWIGPGNVQAIPKNLVNNNQIQYPQTTMTTAPVGS